MANIRHLYRDEAPQAAALARHLQQILPNQSYSRSWFIYPFLLSRLDNSRHAFKSENLPHARHFENMGQIFIRSGTGADDTYCLFTCGGILAQHRHYDALNFVIYHHGFLALDSGTRYNEVKNGQHLANYYAQTVAHNCILIHQPGEPPARYWGGTVTSNHGGQHKQLGSVVKAFETNDDYVYVAGDATVCYQHGVIKRKNQPNLPEKCGLVTRQIVFIIPNHFVIFDRVTATNPAYRKDWLIHTANKPDAVDDTTRIDHNQGRMFCRTLLPENAKRTFVGGPGREFQAASKTWSIETGSLKPENLALMGRWRMEISPSTPSKEDIFLHVIQVGDRKLKAMVETELIKTGRRCGVRLRIGDAVWQVDFDITGKIGGHIKRTNGGKTINTELTDTVQQQKGIMAN